MLARLLPAAAIILLVCAGCDDREIIKGGSEPGKAEQEARAVGDDIAALANGAHQDDPERSVAYADAIARLTRRGTPVEPSLIDALRGNPDPFVRIGCIEVLQSIGSKACIEHLIAVLDDPAPLVAWHADITLRVLCKTRMIPEAGKPPIGDLPPVPQRSAEDVELDAEERIWTEWHQNHHQALRAAWERWWAEQKKSFTLE